jgi:hypothetical protein
MTDQVLICYEIHRNAEMNMYESRVEKWVDENRIELIEMYNVLRQDDYIEIDTFSSFCRYMYKHW